MKLQKIKDVRVGQIWEYKDFLIEVRPRECFQGIYHNGIQTVNLDIDSSFWDELYKKSKLIGFLGITHKIEDNKLIEISREEFEIDDIVEYEGNKMPYIIMEENTIDEELWLHSNEEDVSGIYKDSMEEEGFKKVGILGVNYEFINDKLIME